MKKFNEKSKQKIEHLESECQKEKQACKEKVNHLEANYKQAFDHLAELDKRIGNISSTMSEMGSQLENLSKPRFNLYEAQKTAKYFDKFMDGVNSSGVFADESKLEQAAEVIYKLNLISSDLKDERQVEMRRFHSSCVNSNPRLFLFLICLDSNKRTS